MKKIFVFFLTGLSLLPLAACGGWPSPPGHVTAVNANVVNATTIDVSWDRVEGANAYLLYRNGTSIEQLDSNSVTDMGLANGTRYCYQVASVHGDEESPLSQPPACANTTGR